jgi:hypothetical protein
MSLSRFEAFSDGVFALIDPSRFLEGNIMFLAVQFCLIWVPFKFHPNQLTRNHSRSLAVNPCLSKARRRDNVQSESITSAKMLQCHPNWENIHYSYQLQV